MRLMQWLIGAVQDGMKTHPVLTWLFCVIAAALILYAQYTFAGKSDVERLNLRIDSLECKFDRRWLAADIRRLESDIYFVGRVVSSDEANDRDHARYSILKSDHAAKVRELELLNKICDR